MIRLLILLFFKLGFTFGALAEEAGMLILLHQRQKLFQRVITVSLETMKIVNNLPKLDLLKD